MEYRTLWEANRARQKEWDPASGVTMAYRGNELAGEMGEACNVIKKLEREKLGIRGSRATKQDLADELADVVICTYLVAIGASHDDTISNFDVTTGYYTDPALHMVVSVGHLCEAIEVDEYLLDDLLGVLRAVNCLAKKYDIDINAAVVKKFNETSEKYGLATRLVPASTTGAIK